MIKVSVRCKISSETWEQVKTAYAAGIGLREIARNMDLSQGTVLSRAKRERWTQQIATAKIARQPELAKEVIKNDAINAITPMQSAALTMQQRAERHVHRMAGVTEKVLPHLESMQPSSILDRVHDIEKYDRLTRRNYGLSDNQGDSSSLNLNILSGRGRTLIAIDHQPNNVNVASTPSAAANLESVSE